MQDLLNSPVLAAVRKEASAPLYLVGGALRDILLKRRIIDLDFAYQGPAKPFAEKIARALRGTLVVLDEATRVYRIALSKPEPGPDAVSQIDIAQIVGRDIQEDLRRRDFACNAMALPLPPIPKPIPANIRKNLLDPRGGLKDLRGKILRANDPAVFTEDPLRLLRAFRLAAQLGLAIEPKTLAMIAARRGLVRRPAGERIRQELLAVLSSPDSHAWLREMDRAGVLTGLIPEFEASRKCALVYYGRGGVLLHSLDAVARMDLLLNGLDLVWPDLADKILQHFEGRGNWRALLRLGVLLHDVAKPATARRIKNRLRFFGHEEKGARMAHKILEGFRFSRREMEAVEACIRHHLRPGNLAANARITDKAVFRFFKDVGPHGVELLLLCWADHASYLTEPRLRKILPYAREDPHLFSKMGSVAADARKTLHHLQVSHFLLHRFFHQRERVAPPKLLDGHAVMKISGLPSGPAIGKILAKLREAQAVGKVADREAAVRFVRKIKIKQ